jgi:adenylate cyclase
MSEYTREKLGDEFVCRSLDRVRTVGINTPVRLYELLGLRNDPGIRPEIREQEYLAHWEKAMDHFERGLFERAKELFSFFAEKSPEDGVAQFYLGRCSEYINSPPGAWEGINNLTEK